MRSAAALLAALAVLSGMGSAAAVTLTQLESKVNVQDATLTNLGNRVTAQGLRTTALTGRVNVLNNTVISLDKLKVGPAIIKLDNLQNAVQGLLNIKAQLLALPAGFANLTTVVNDLAQQMQTQSDSLAALQVNLQPLLDNKAGLLNLAVNANSLLALLNPLG
ncbi:hypothetical protein ABPG75_003613 [Micractinium tetrahymenae]